MPKNDPTTTKFRVDISELKAAMQEARKQVAYANSEFKATSSAMDDWSKSSDGLAAKLKQLKSNLSAQKAVLSEYEKTLQNVKKEYGENSAEAREYETKLNNQKTVVNKVEQELKQYEKALEEVSEAEKEAEKTGKSVAEVLEDMGDEAEEAEGGFTILKGAIAEFVGNALTELVNGLKDAISYLGTFANDAEKAMNSFAAETGATADEMAEFKDSMVDIYQNNFGENFEDIAQAMAEVKKQAGDIGADELEKMTTNALMMRDTFEFEVNESMRAAKMLMDQFGLSGDEAYNLIAQGAQGGLDKNGDLLDSINEYSVHFQQLGFNAEEMFNMLANGSAAGTFSVDKLGDAFKEFGIRVKDGSDSTAAAFDYLGYDADELFKTFNEGGQEAAEMTAILIDELTGMPDSVEKTTAGVALFGSMWEDLGAEGLSALGQLTGEISVTKDALEQINGVKYNDIGSAIEGIKRNLEVSLLMPIGENILPKVNELAAKFSEWLNNPETQAAIQDLSTMLVSFAETALAAIVDGIRWVIDNKEVLLAAISGIAAGFAAFKLAQLISWIKDLGGVITVLKAAFAALGGPVTIIVTIIAALVAGFITLWNTSEEFRAFWINLWESIKTACGKAKDWIAVKLNEIGEFFTKTLPDFFNQCIEWVKSNWDTLLIMFVNPFAGLFKYFYENSHKFREFVDSAIEQIRQLPERVWTWLLDTINKIEQWKTNMQTKAQEAAMNFLNTVVNFIKELPGKAWTWLQNTVSQVVSWGASMAASGRQAASELVTSVVNKITELPGKLVNIGKDIVRGLWNGIGDMDDWLKGKIEDWVGDVASWIKKFFKIGSPSRLMADEVGRWLPEGIAVGIEKNSESVLDSMRGVVSNVVTGAREGVSGGTTGAGIGGSVVNYYQTINSPKQLNRLEIYRQSKNLLGYAKG